MKICILLVSIAALAGCGAITSGEKPARYRATITGNFVENTVEGPRACKYNRTLSGEVWVELRREGVVEGDGGVNLQFGGSSLLEGNATLCGGSSSSTQSTGGWSADLSGTGSNVLFRIRRTDSNAAPTNPNVFSIDYDITFSGVLSGSSIPGTLTVSRSGSGNLGGQSTTSTGSATFNVALQR